MMTSEDLRTVVKHLDSDFEPYGKRSRDEDWGPDCSCGCRYFAKITGELGYDWGVCANPKSPRAGLLTFEHMGCKEFEGDGKSIEDWLKEWDATMDEKGIVHFRK